MALPWLGVVLVAVAYLSAAVPYGLIIARARGVDIRKVGSGNIGATNAARALGKRLGAFVLLLDILKGLGPVLAARLLLPCDDPGPLWLAGTMVASVLGHMFPIFLGLRGGKGVATGLGVILVASPWAGLAGIVLYAGLYAALRISSLGSLVGTLAAPVVMYFTGSPLPVCVAGLAIGILIVIKHHENIRRLIRREEGRI
jgi:acyl phosphate:glycerol-3-phosphate acyltransferase